ncbi:hypothetical protein [Ralstonia pseudosolanacearum]|uniref:Uncharacterized protein n=1 Tax=Ralstonia solanacearum TaxID=305 RepID=A0AA92EI38_RALSL|nr:hypothetical protein [Ralstonia pseudosolanacearum]QCX51681.1 hypothetical protein E7Z57_21945 [Ralstonia pseudosolanacearum]
MRSEAGAYVRGDGNHGGGLRPGFRDHEAGSGETALAAARISKDVCGRLQSHGITGVRDRHYDGHEYMDEKRHALEALFALLDSPAQSNVAPLIAA